jgi:hypothetical protein
MQTFKRLPGSSNPCGHRFVECADSFIAFRVPRKTEYLIQAQLAHKLVGTILAVLTRDLSEYQAGAVAIVTAAKPGLNEKQLARFLEGHTIVGP